MGTTLMPGVSMGTMNMRDALVLGHLGVGAGGQPDVVGPPGQRGVDLLAVDDVLVAVADRTGLERGQVGTRLRFGVPDAEVDVAGQDLREEEVLLLLGPELHDGRPDRVDGQHGHRRTGPHGLVEEDVLLDGRAALAPVSSATASSAAGTASSSWKSLVAHQVHALGSRSAIFEVNRRMARSASSLPGIT